jgi:hypothetical protein
VSMKRGAERLTEHYLRRRRERRDHRHVAMTAR